MEYLIYLMSIVAGSVAGYKIAIELHKRKIRKIIREVVQHEIKMLSV